MEECLGSRALGPPDDLELVPLSEGEEPDCTSCCSGTTHCEHNCSVERVEVDELGACLASGEDDKD